MTRYRYVNDRELTFIGYSEVFDDGDGRGPSTRTLVAEPDGVYEIVPSDPALTMPPPPSFYWEEVRPDPNAAPGQEQPAKKTSNKEKG